MSLFNTAFGTVNKPPAKGDAKGLDKTLGEIMAVGVVGFTICTTGFACGYMNPVVFGANHNAKFIYEISPGMRMVNGVCALLATNYWLILKVASYGTRHLF